MFHKKPDQMDHRINGIGGEQDAGSTSVSFEPIEELDEHEFLINEPPPPRSSHQGQRWLPSERRARTKPGARSLDSLKRVLRSMGLRGGVKGRDWLFDQVPQKMGGQPEMDSKALGKLHEPPRSRAGCNLDELLEEDEEKSHGSDWRPRAWRPSWTLLLTACLSVALVLTIYYMTSKDQHKPESPADKIAESLITGHRTLEKVIELRKTDKWVVSNPKCHIPNIEPWDKSISNHVSRQKPVNCTQILVDELKSGGWKPTMALTFVQANRLRVNPVAEAAYGLQINLDCCFRWVDRSIENDHDLIYGEKCEPLGTEWLLAAKWTPRYSLIKLECPRFNYTNLHAFIIENQEEDLALDKVASERLLQGQNYNVVLLGLDTMSRLNGERQLPMSLDILRSKLGAIDFYGYNKVGENTFPNLVPLITGLTPAQLMQTDCWHKMKNEPPSEEPHEFLDNCKYLWNFYQQFGYSTYYSEDWPAASTFNFVKKGFKRAPTNHYGRPFTLARDPILSPPVQMGCRSPCLWDKPVVELDLDNLGNFIESQASSGRPFFALHWINCPQHDDLNGASMIDHIVAEFIKTHAEAIDRTRTFLVFFSDHGYRWGSFVSSYVGHYEASLPMLLIAPPSHFKSNHRQLYENLRRHQRTLLTPFDLFKTLVDIRDLSAKPPVARRDSRAHLADNVTEPTTEGPSAGDTIKQLTMEDGLSFKQSFQTISLLGQQNASQLDRTCSEAGIPDNYCVCHQFEKLDGRPEDNPLALAASLYYVHAHIYGILHGHLELCAPLELKSIESAEVFDLAAMKSRAKSSKAKRAIAPSRPQEQNDGYEDDEPDPPVKEEKGLPNKEYNIKIRTKPGDALFQEVVRFYGSDEGACKEAVDKLMNVIKLKRFSHNQVHKGVLKMNRICKFLVHNNSTSRLNLYKNQSGCIENNTEVKKVCYCNDLIK